MDEALLAIINAGQGASQEPDSPANRRQNETSQRRNRATRRSSEAKDGGSSSEDDELLSEGEEWGEVQTWDPDTLMGDDADQQRLSQMSELQREAILAERKSKFERMRERLEVKRMLKRRMSGQNKQKRTQEDEAGRTSKRQTTEKAKWGNSIANLRREREKKRSGAKDERDTHRRKDRASSESGSDYEDLESLAPKTATLSEPSRKTPGKMPSLSDLLATQVTRAELVDWVFAPYFDTTAQGCFVRYGLGQDPKNPKVNVYRVCLLSEIRPAPKTYMVDAKPVHKLALMSHGKAQRENSFSKVSNSPITETEYRRWVETMKYDQMPEISAAAIAKKKDDLQRAREYVLNHEEVAKIVEQKRALNRIPVNVASELTELKRRLEHAKTTGNSEEEKKVQDRLDRIYESLGTKAAKPSASSLGPARDANGDEKAPPRMSSGITLPGMRVNGDAFSSVDISHITNEWDARFAFDPALDHISADMFPVASG
ncbi:hypothetical protein DFS34DRAFT_647967 [Phlyctochytrium arcticum]|nr:hypothetical protein DFS34DRAFT_647967 [Phlyctochytrium arcticum]